MALLNFRYTWGDRKMGGVCGILCFIFLLYPSIVLGVSPENEDGQELPSSGTSGESGLGWQFSSPKQENAFYAVLDLRKYWAGSIERVYGRVGDEKVPKDFARFLQNVWEETKSGLDQQECELFFGKEFFMLFMQYYQDLYEGTQKYLADDFDGAISFLRKARASADQLKEIPMQNRDKMPALCVDKMVITISICVGAIQCSRGDTAGGIVLLRAAYAEATKAKWREGKAQAAYYMALYAQQAKAPYAKSLYQQALQVAQKNKIPFFISQCYLRLGLMDMEIGNPAEAIEFLQEASNVLGAMRSKVEEDIQKTTFENDNFQIYRLMTVALMDMGIVEKAFELSENAKSRVLQDLLRSNRKVSRWAEMNRSLLLQEQTMEEQIVDLESMGGKGAETALALLRQGHENVLKRIRKTNPDYGLLKIVEPTELKNVQALLDDRTVLLEYNQISECLVTWLVTKNSIRMEKIPLDAEKMTQKVQAIRMMIGKPNMPAVYKLLGQLYGDIIKPFEKDIQGKTLILVPDAALHLLPFAALVDENGKFLAESHTTSVVPSFTILEYCMAKKRGQTKTILAFGNPDLGDPKMNLPNAELEVRSIAKQFPLAEPALRSNPGMDLPNAELEVKNIAAQFPQTTVYLRKEASEALARTIMGRYDVIHFACHGELDMEDSMRSCLRLAPEKGSDGKLEAGEIFDLKLNAKLVVLSGCETGRGFLTQGEEMLGLTRSFIYAGTPSVVVSLWKVDDNATALLMTNFYKNLAKMGKADALRQAQIATMKTKKHPYYWASFYLVGDGR